MKIGENSKSEQINNQLSVSEQQSSSKMKIKNTSHQTNFPRQYRLRIHSGSQ